MVRVFLVAGLILSALIVAVFGPRWLKTGESEREERQVTCELAERSCQWIDAKGRWTVQIRPMNDDDGSKYLLLVESPQESGNLMAVLRGVDMYMGEYPIPLSQTGEGRYEAMFAAPFCSTGEKMRWQVDLQGKADSPPINSVKLLFQPLNA
ncbi:hypothetical protein LPB19_11695 [Marinobacter salinisoli]|uniref:Uncharacterized protein n=1 Tax=Marinobacter salinisoli TaxID=2769486 RepID=A0ABX7MUC9_9GAMM|nr:hypothetical protein [Marinobacter salinisoli]QSP93858.1 hypothetical protein LPB19_11695 [Marinobacter salinisoli]